VPTIILTSVTGFLSVSNVGYFSTENSKFVSLACGLVNLVVSIINMLEAFKKVENHLNLNQSTYYNLVRLRDDISFVLSIPTMDRKQSGIDTVTEFYERFELIVKESTILNNLPDNLLGIKQLLNRTITERKSSTKTKVKKPQPKQETEINFTINFN
ncbi:hypothetical protein EBU95_18840, partial [bacterium]|nr:hypothetical protein [bacterium]